MCITVPYFTITLRAFFHKGSDKHGEGKTSYAKLFSVRGGGGKTSELLCNESWRINTCNMKNSTSQDIHTAAFMCWIAPQTHCRVIIIDHHHPSCGAGDHKISPYTTIISKCGNLLFLHCSFIIPKQSLYIGKVWSMWSNRSPFANGWDVQSISSTRLFLWHLEDVTEKFHLAVPNQGDHSMENIAHTFIE